MGGVTDLEFEKYCKVGQSPKTVLRLPRHQSKVENRSRREKPDLRKDQLVIEKNIKELKFRNYRSISCKTLPSRNAEAVDRKVLNRCSVYQSSLERRPRRLDAVEERKKIEFSLGNEAPFSFSLLDSVCGSDEEGEEPLEINKSANKETSTVNKIAAGSVERSREPSSLDLPCRETSCSSKPAERDLMENLKFRSHRVKGPANSANTLKEKDDQALRKSLSAKLAMPHSPTRSDNDGSNASPKSRFSPFMKMFEPFSKSKSHRSVPKSKSECKDNKSSGSLQTGENKTFRKSLLQDFSSTAGPPHVESGGSLLVNKENHEQIVPPPCKPGHLQGYLKVEEKHGVPYYTLSLSHTEDVYVAKTWKADDALSWAYTFHSIQGGKKSNASNQGGLKYSNKNPPIVGQMQVSSHLGSEVSDLEGAVTDSMVSEFVLYDILHVRKSLVSEESNPPDVAEIPGGSNDVSDVSTTFSDNILDSVKGKGLGTSNPFDPSNNNNNGLDFSSPYPWNPADLHTRFESAAIVIEVPFEKRESLKYRVGDSISRQVHFNLLDRSVEEQTRRAVSDAYNKARVKVVTPIGNHSWPTPSSDSRGPSQLLDRWRLGGGCDCGGWDMGCPLIVYSDQTTCSGEEHFILRSDQPCDLFLQGSKESTPVLTMQHLGKGHYAINFHAQLSALQAFAVYVSILHTREVSISVNQEKNRQIMKCYSTKVLVGDEIKTLIEEVTREERKEKVRGATDTGHHPHPSYVLNPPFSPIARV